jgi:hypothetical protein
LPFCRFVYKRRCRTQAKLVAFGRNPGAEQKEEQKNKHKLYPKTTRYTNARTKRNDFPVGVRKRMNPPQPPTYTQTSTREHASLCQTCTKTIHTHADTHTYSHRDEEDAVPPTRGALPGKAYIRLNSISSQTTNRYYPTPTISRQTPPPTSKP